ncbi:MAG: GerMN domain-containing protein [Treponema sp.]|jgi:hypothetical protein|nr:GerMN domain-containing protein [Treponema sp.]
MKTLYRLGGSVAQFLRKKTRRRFLYLCALLLLAFADFLFLGLARRTFVFYSIDNHNPVAEDRMVAKTGSRESDIKRYVEEALLGPVALDSAPLFPRGTRLASLLYRDGVVYADLSESAALGAPEGPGVFAALSALYGGVKRNFSYVKDMRLFIAGREAYPEKFRELFGSYADI